VDQSCPALAQLIELGFETVHEAAGGAVGCELAVLPAAKVELELGAGDGYKPRDLWLAQAAVSGVKTYLTNQQVLHHNWCSRDRRKLCK
jgi:hypothetical protein